MLYLLSIQHVFRQLIFFTLFIFCTKQVPRVAKNVMYVQQKGVLTFAKHRAAILLYPHSFSLMFSYTVVTNVLPPKLPSPVVITPNRYPFCMLRFHTFLLHLFTVVLLFAHTHAIFFNYATSSLSCVLFYLLNHRTTTLLLSDFSLGFYFL